MILLTSYLFRKAFKTCGFRLFMANRRRKTNVWNRVKTAGKVAVIGIASVTALGLGALTYDQNTGNLSKVVGEYVSKNESHGKRGQYWEGIKEHDDFLAKLKGEKEDNKKVVEEFPDPSIIDKWPLTEDNSITILSGDKNPVVLVGKAARRETVRCEDIPQVVKDALTFREDQDFYTHGGINWRGKLRLAKPVAALVWEKINSDAEDKTKKDKSG